MSSLTGEMVSFGVDAESTIGIVQNAGTSDSAEIAEIRDETGKIVFQKAYSKTSEKTSAAGTVLTVGTGNSAWSGIVTKSSITKSNRDFTKVSITAIRKDDATSAAYS